MPSSARKPVPRYRPTESSSPPERIPMSRTLAKLTPKPPKELASFFADPPLVGEESREDYESLFSALAVATKPADTIVWILVRDVADLTWEIQREKWLKRQVIQAAREDVVKEILMPPPIDQFAWDAHELESDPEREAEIETAFKKLEDWASGPSGRRRVDLELAAGGYDAAYISRKALTDSASDTDAIDKRISAYENRRYTVLREIDRYNESLARRLEKVSSDIIEGEFTEAAA
jgi:hypothetical protein